MEAYKIPALIPASDGLFDRHPWKVEHNGWLFYIGGGLQNPHLVVVTPQEMASQGRKAYLLHLPLDNDEQFYRWVREFIAANGL